MTSPARIAMLFAARDALEEAKRVAVKRAEMYLAATPEERETIDRFDAEHNTPEKVRARAQRLSRAKRRRMAAERGARTVRPQTVDMSAFEAQFRA